MTDHPYTDQHLDDIDAVVRNAAQIGADIDPATAAALLAEVHRLRDRVAEYEVLNPQQCPAGKHADWLVDSEYAHACPWCQIEALKPAVEAHVVADDSSDPEHVDDCPGCETPARPASAV